MEFKKGIKTMKPKLKLIGKDGNAFYILSAARHVAEKNKWEKSKIEEIMEEAQSGDYNNLLRTMAKYFDIY